MNMIKPQKKSKSAGFMAILLTIIMIIACFTTACQPTPKGLIVQNKADDDLKEAIAQTATPTSSDINTSDSTVTSETASANQQDTQPNEPIDHIEDTSSNASNTVTVEIDADVINNQPDNIPVAKIVPYYFTEADVEQLAKAFFGYTQFYDGVYTKSDFDTRIVKLQYRISNDEELLKSDYATAGEKKNIEEVRKHYQKSLERMIEDRENASDENVALSSFFEASPYALADLGDGFMGYIYSDEEAITFSAFKDDTLYPAERSIISVTAPYTQLDINNTDAEFENAKQMATNMISKMGINAVVGDVFLADDPISGTNRQYYVFCFEKVINESKLDHTALYGAASYSKSDDDVYEKLRAYERLELWIEGNKFVQFKYTLPMQVTEILNENVALNIDYTQAIELAKQHAYVAFVDTYGNFSESKVAVNKIELTLVRTKQANTGDYIVVPAWNFYGDLLVKQKIDDGEFKSGEWRLYNRFIEFDFEYPIITINALDGTIIDMEHGY